MGWRGYQTSIDPGMLFKKMYCHKCGTKLKKKKITKICKRDDYEFTDNFKHSTAIGMNELSIAHFIYVCPNCGSEITYENQCLVAKKQKKLKSKIINESEIKFVKEKFLSNENKLRNLKLSNKILLTLLCISLVIVMGISVFALTIRKQIEMGLEILFAIPFIVLVFVLPVINNKNKIKKLTEEMKKQNN